MTVNCSQKSVNNHWHVVCYVDQAVKQLAESPEPSPGANLFCFLAWERWCARIVLKQTAEVRACRMYSCMLSQAAKQVG